jgi:hypothetical protein
MHGAVVAKAIGNHESCNSVIEALVLLPSIGAITQR